MSRNRITGHTFNRLLNGDSNGTIKVKWNNKTEYIKWKWDSEYGWQMWGATQEVISFAVAYIEYLTSCFNK